MSEPDEHIRQLRSRLAAAAAGAPELTHVLRGTVGRRYVRCGSKGCHCRVGQGHGPILYFSASLGAGRTKQVTLTEETYETAQRYVRNYARLKEVLEEISEINREILQEERHMQRQGRRPPDGP
jgi:hypothetical protein